MKDVSAMKMNQVISWYMQVQPRSSEPIHWTCRLVVSRDQGIRNDPTTVVVHVVMQKSPLFLLQATKAGARPGNDRG